MAEERAGVKRLFTYEEACALLPEVQRITGDAVAAAEQLAAEEGEPGELEGEESEAVAARYQALVTRWADEIMAMGIEVKGLWLIDFDSGSGYYCWHHPEPALQFFHGYEEGFSGRVELN
jgi:hypothetical protein